MTYNSRTITRQLGSNSHKNYRVDNEMGRIRRVPQESGVSRLFPRDAAVGRGVVCVGCVRVRDVSPPPGRDIGRAAAADQLTPYRLPRATSSLFFMNFSWNRLPAIVSFVMTPYWTLFHTFCFQTFCYLHTYLFS